MGSAALARGSVAPAAPPFRVHSPETPQPYGLIPAEAWADPSLSLRAKAILGGLAIIARGARDGVRASYQELAYRCGCDPRTVRRGVAELAAAGLVEFDQVGKDFRFLFRLQGRQSGAEPAARQAHGVQHGVRAGCAPKEPPPATPYKEGELDSEKDERPGAAGVSVPAPPSPGPMNPDPPSDPAREAEVDRVGRMAEEVTGDVSWRIWVDQNAKMGHPPGWIEAAIDEMVNAEPPVIRRDYAAGILRRYAREGGPRKRPAGPSRSRPWTASKPTNMPYSGRNLPPDLDAGEFELAPGEYDAIIADLRRKGVIS